ncbi:hypothetical protein ABZ297_20330 [Nonomuraea sp. NPDC005983]|uniref:hypothetical protein n=1 Tax=Nonomuraea sp. NPDC005983 TaxID=3155595 RepID=UPI0033B00969
MFPVTIQKRRVNLSGRFDDAETRWLGWGEVRVLFGTEPMFRDHPKRLFPQVARALYRSRPGHGQHGRHAVIGIC